MYLSTNFLKSALIDLNIKKIVVIFGVFFFLSSELLMAQIERRREVMSSDFGYLVAPLPFRLEGVGTGLGVAAYLNNIGGTNADVFGVGIAGDVSGYILGASDLGLFDNHLLFDVVNLNFSAGQGKIYNTRGMDSDKDSYNILEFEDTSIKGGRMILNFYRRMLELYVVYYEGESVAKRVRNSSGDVIAEYDDNRKNTFASRSIGLNIDYTDDRTDPRKGLRLLLQRSDNPRAGRDSEIKTSKQFTFDYNLTGYIPVLDISTLALNFFDSEAHITSKGETDLNVIRDNSGLNCPDDPNSECYQSRESIVEQTYLSNVNGNATSLGGNSRLRSFPEGRYVGGVSQFIGAEFRLNLTSENTPYNLFFTKDFRTGVQVAMFYEQGSVAETRSELWDESKYSTGLGLRLVTGSGFIYRFDVSYGNEGTGVILFFDYPWGNIQ